MVIDTNIALDLLVFQDAACSELDRALDEGQLVWTCTSAMGLELQRVLDYPKIARRREFHGLSVAQVMGRFERRTQVVADAARAPFVCKDPDDQIYVNLAVAHRALLLSKDLAVLALRRRLLTLGVRVEKQWLPPPNASCESQNSGPQGPANHYISDSGEKSSIKRTGAKR